MILIFDTETTGLPQNYNAPLTDFNNWPRVVQIAWQLHEPSGKLVSQGNRIVRPDGFSIPYNAEKVHGISTDRALREGLPLSDVMAEFLADVAKATIISGHNIEFDLNITGCELLRLGQDNVLPAKKIIDTKEVSTDFCALPGGKGGRFKWPTLTELHHKLFGNTFAEAHDAAYDVDATAKCFFGLLSHRVMVLPEAPNPEAILYEAPELEAGNFSQADHSAQATTPSSTPPDLPTSPEPGSTDTETRAFVHLHVHSQYSILQSTVDVEDLVKRTLESGASSVALTDHGNMMGAFAFVAAAAKHGVKAIVGAELNLCRNRLDKQNKDDGYQTVLLARNKHGYHNLAMLSSIGYTEGFYYVPRIDREMLLRHKEDLIVTTGGLWSEVPWLILNVGEEKAEEAFLWWKEHFGENFYGEIMRHGIEEEDVVNRVILRFCRTHGVRYFASNNVYYLNREDSVVQDALLCVKDSEAVSRPTKYIGKRGREFRFGLPNDAFYLKSPAEMTALFSDLPEAVDCTALIAGSCESYSLKRDVLLPKFDIPAEFRHPEDEADGGKRGENAYLRHLTMEGAARRYGELTQEIRERLEFELETIARTGYPGYFLIVQDFCNEARRQGVAVGPGRGSAAGSAVAYCIGITNVDPIRYDLLFERFLNPERVSLPDIDIDFDDEGRDRVIEYVRNKYSRNAVAQIITYGTMAGKSSIKDSARVFEMPIAVGDMLSKLLPANASLSEVLKMDERKLSDTFSGDELQNVRRLREIANQGSDQSNLLSMAGRLEGSIRNTGIHACGVIITPDDITRYVPVATARDTDMWCTQFDNSVVESAGLLKMDFLGLKTLTLIKDTVRIVRERSGVELDPDQFPLDDEKTYQLFQRGETIGIFQYESAGMQKYMRELKPTVFDDLIAMNALYRPGPLEYIPDFIKRKHGLEPIVYDLPEMEEYLKDTYGITVYQEQVMLLSQKLGGFTKGEADVLRKAMGKKQKDVLDKMKGKFIEGATALGHPADKLEKIWTDWEAFASYAFNKSHSTCYAWVGYQTAYLKANYPAEYMAAVLSNNINDIKQVTLFMQECRRMHIPVLSPDVNESLSKFSVNQKGEIRFGLAAVKGVGESAVESIITERHNGPYTTIYDFMRRVDARTANKRVLESLVLSGAFDSFGHTRSAYFTPDGRNDAFLETLVRYANATRENKTGGQASLFGETAEALVPEPPFPAAQPWDTLSQLNKEKEMVGIFISGHPLDDFILDIRSFCHEEGLALLNNLNEVKNREFRFAGVVRSAEHKTSKNGKPYGSFILEDYQESHEFRVFGEDYLRFKSMMDAGYYLFVAGRVQERPFGQNPGELEFKILRIELLADVREKLGKFLDLRIAAHKLDEPLINELDKLLKTTQGKTQVRFRIMEGTTEITALSGSHTRIAVNYELMESLDALPAVEARLAEA